MRQPSDFLTTKEVAELCRRTPQTVRKWASTGSLSAKGKLPGGAYLFRRDEVEQFIVGNLDEPVDEPSPKFRVCRDELSRVVNKARRKRA